MTSLDYELLNSLKPNIFTQNAAMIASICSPIVRCRVSKLPHPLILSICEFQVTALDAHLFGSVLSQQSRHCRIRRRPTEGARRLSSIRYRVPFRTYFRGCHGLSTTNYCHHIVRCSVPLVCHSCRSSHKWQKTCTANL